MPVLRIKSQCLQQNGHPKGVRTVQKFSSFERNNLRSKISFEENTPSGGSHGMVWIHPRLRAQALLICLPRPIQRMVLTYPPLHGPRQLLPVTQWLQALRRSGMRQSHIITITITMSFLGILP